MSVDFQTDRRQALVLAGAGAMLPLTGVAAAKSVAPGSQATWPLRDIPFDDDWRFHRGGGDGFDQPGLDDSNWRTVDLPHDWGVEDVPGGAGPARIGPFDEAAVGKGATGFTIGGEGWYRKRFSVARYAPDTRIELLFDGIYLESDVFLNGHPVLTNVHGYIPFAVDLTPYLDRSGDNVVAVRVRNEGRNTRWYAGSGIYRQVTLDVLPSQCRISRWGVSAWTRRFAEGRAEIDLTTSLDGVAERCQVVTRLVDGEGRIVAQARSDATGRVRQTLTVQGPQLWSPDHPYLYQLETELRREGRVVDRVVQPFGVRIVTFDPARGMAINGEVTKLRGGCMHHDNGLLGACAFRDADERRIRLLKQRGFNAIRSSHNPASRGLREACDRLGMLLIEEAFDVWHEHKEPQDFSAHFREHWEEVIRAMVLPARNNASVIMWSIGNEIPLRASEEGVEWEWKLANAVKALDPTRPVTAGLNGVLGQEMVAGTDTARPGFAGKVDNASTIFLDVPGYNYRLDDIEREYAGHPERVVYASETFAREVFDYAALMDRAPYFLGEFVWTAMDYIGEAGIGATAFLKNGSPPYYFAAWPWVNAWCGDLDLIGCQKPSSLARDVAWGRAPIAMTVKRPTPEGTFAWTANWGWPDELASWNWDGQQSKPLNVRIYTVGDKVQVILNGQVVGEKILATNDRMTAELPVPFTAGTLEAAAWKNGKVIGRTRLVTVDEAASLSLSLEPLSGRRGREALAFLTIEVVDAKGRVLPDDMRSVALSLEGSGELVAFGSANPRAVGSLKAHHAQTFRGRALAILRGRGKGTLRVTVNSPGLPAANTRVVFE